MRDRSSRCLTIAAVLLICLPVALIGQGRAESFGLKDQNNKYVEVNFPSDRPVVLIFGDRKGSDQIDGWSKPIYSDFSDSVYVFGIASLSGVPSYAQGLVRRLIKRQTAFPVLLDWGGKVSKTFGYPKDKALLVLLDRDGTVITTRSGPATTSEIDAVKAEINKRKR